MALELAVGCRGEVEGVELDENEEDAGTTRDEAVPDLEREFRDEVVLECLLLALPVERGVLGYIDREVVEMVLRLLRRLSVEPDLCIFVCPFDELSDKTCATPRVPLNPKGESSVEL